jgi:hypothetical protein
MNIDEFCYLLNVRKRKVLKHLPETELGTELATRITRSMLYKRTFVLTIPELELLVELYQTPANAKVFAEEIAKEREWAKVKSLPNA